MRIHRLPLVAAILLGCQASPAPAPAPPAHPELASELVAMEADDQELRAELTGFLRDHPGETPPMSLALRMVILDRKHTARLREIVADHGWPSVDLVGREAADAAWLLAQHADHDPEFQADVLERIRPLMDTGEVAAADVALLTDRVLTGRELPQRYGSQYSVVELEGVLHFGPTTPIEDPEHLDERRASMGMGPHAEYVEQVREYYGVTDETPPLPED